MDISRSINKSEESEFWLGKNHLKELKEKSYNDLYRNSTSCTIYIKNTLLEIKPSKYLGKNKGLGVSKEKSLSLPYPKEDNFVITELIIKALG